MGRFSVYAVALTGLVSLEYVDAYVWKNVYTGAGGGWIGNIIFNQKQKGVAFCRADIGGAYRLNADDSWTPLLDWANASQSNYWGVESIATDPVNPQNLYIEVGLYTNSYDANNGTLLISNDQGNSFKEVPLPFKVGGNMPGRGSGERLAIDPNNNSILYLGARSGHGLWKSTNSGLTWSNVTSFPAVGNFVQDPSDTSGYNSDQIGIGWVIFDTTSPSTSAGTSRIFVGAIQEGQPAIFQTNDHGVTWSALPGQNTTYLPRHAVLAPAEKSLYVTYVDTAGPFDGSHGSIYKYNITSQTWTNITPAQAISDNSYGFGGVTVDALNPGVVLTASLNEYYPDAELWRSLDGGKTWSNIYSYSYPPPDYQLDVVRNYGWDLSSAPWIWSYTTDSKQVGWGIEGLQIDPFDSNHFLYGTGLSLYGSRNLQKWDTVHNITLASMARGIEETAVLALVSPPVGPPLISAVGDIGGWSHTDLTTPPSTLHTPLFGTDNGIDYAGQKPTYVVRVGNAAGQIATSTDSGATWTLYPNTPSNVGGGQVKYSANATSIIWISGGNVYVAKNGGAFVQSTGLPSGTTVVAADRVNDSYVYASYGGKVYVSSNGGTSFSFANVLGSAQSSNGIAVNNLGAAGDFYLTTEHGTWHATNFGKSLVGGSALTSATSIAVGPSAIGGSTPSVYAAGSLNGVESFYRSDDGLQSWKIITDAQHGFTQVSGSVLAGDPRIPGRVYVGTNGRGIWYGDLQ